MCTADDLDRAKPALELEVVMLPASAWSDAQRLLTKQHAWSVGRISVEHAVLQPG